MTYGKYRKRLKINLPMQEECTSSFCHLFRIRFFLCFPSSVVVYTFFSFFDYLNVSFLVVFAFYGISSAMFYASVPNYVSLSFKTSKKRLISTLGNQYNGTGFFVVCMVLPIC